MTKVKNEQSEKPLFYQILNDLNYWQKFYEKHLKKEIDDQLNQNQNSITEKLLTDIPNKLLNEQEVQRNGMIKNL